MPGPAPALASAGETTGHGPETASAAHQNGSTSGQLPAEATALPAPPNTLATAAPLPAASSSSSSPDGGAMQLQQAPLPQLMYLLTHGPTWQVHSFPSPGTVPNAVPYNGAPSPMSSSPVLPALYKALGLPAPTSTAVKQPWVHHGMNFWKARRDVWLTPGLTGLLGPRVHPLSGMASPEAMDPAQMEEYEVRLENETDPFDAYLLTSGLTFVKPLPLSAAVCVMEDVWSDGENSDFWEADPDVVIRNGVRVA